MNQNNKSSSNNSKASIDDLKALLPDYLTGKGIDYKKNFTCLNPGHDDKNPSMTYYADSQTVYCHGCNASFDIFDLFAIDHLNASVDSSNRVKYPNGFKEVYNKLADYMHVNVSKFKVKPEDAERNKINEFNHKVIEAASKQLDQTDYLQKRGISKELAKKFNIGFIPKWVNPTVAIKDGRELTPTPRIIIPTGDASYLARDTRPAEDIPDAEKNYIKIKQGGSHLFNGRALYNDAKPIFIVEGEIDALSVMEVTDQAQAVALGSTSNVDLFCKGVRKIRKNKAAKNADYDPVFLIATDNDNAGRLAAKELEAQLGGNGFETYTVNIARNSKDPNEELVKDRQKFTSEVTDRIKDPDDYLKNLLLRIQERKDKPQFIPTGFKNLDKLLDGGLYPQLYVLGAVSSVGKTTFSMQIADRIAGTQGNPIFYFSLETSKDELTEKNLSRLSFESSIKADKGKPQTARGINNGYWIDHKPEYDLVMDAVSVYSTYYSKIHIYDGTLERPTAQTIRDTMKTYKRKHPDDKPVVFVDYLQILKAINDKDTDKEKVTRSIAEFKKIASELEMPVVVISSFNRSSYQRAVAMESFKESGEIEYYADTLLGLQYRAIHEDTDDPDTMKSAMQSDPREIELVVLKNRNGQSNTSINFEYYPRFNDFVPSEDED